MTKPISSDSDNDAASYAAWHRRQRQRNIALLWVLLGLVALFFAISLVQFGRAGHL